MTDDKIIHIDATNDRNKEKAAFSILMGQKPLPFKDPLTQYEDNKIKLPPWNEFSQKVHKFSGADDRAEFARQAIADSRLIGRPSFDKIDSDPLLKELSDANMRDHLAGWIAWAERSPRGLGDPQSSIWHKVMDAYRSKKIILGQVFDGKYGAERAQQKIGPDHAVFFEEQPQIILIEHNWAAAFDGAQDFSDGEFPLPYERCAFEFLLGGRRMVVVTHGHRCAYVSEIGGGYWVASIISNLNEPSDGRYGILDKNIRAVCIALDAEVAVTDVVRAPHRLNMARENQGKSTINDYHVINLAKRSRIEALPIAGEHEAKWHPRLHFRRGHWRHYENHKTWIKWMLVGDPDLGFIDKEYRA